MALSTSDKIKIICAFGAVILTGLILIGIREWYAPDIRYEEGSFYISGKNAITSLNLKNYGHGDAEDIIISTHFENNINDISIDDKALEVKILNGGIGNKNAIIKIRRIVPDYAISIYFSIDYNQEVISKKGFISNITYKGDKAKTGKPILFDLIFIIFISVILSAITGYGTYHLGIRIVRPKLDELKQKIQELQTNHMNLILESMSCFIKSVIESENKISLNNLLVIMERIKNDTSISGFDKTQQLCNEMCNLCKTINLKDPSEKDKS